MNVKLHGIVLSIVKHNERNNVITLYTAERGRVACLSPAGSGKSGRLRNARLMPLALIESEINFRENRELQFLGSVAISEPWRDLYFNPSKAPIVIFISDFLRRVLHNSEPDTHLWNFLTDSLRILDAARESTANFPIAFMIRMLHFIGIAPDPSDYQPLDYFNMRNAEFTPVRPEHGDVVDLEEARSIPILMKMNFRNMTKFKMNAGQRRRLLRTLIKYYSIHLPIPGEMKSLDVLAEIFS